MHPEADAFLDAIFDHPDDDTARLVYADWLQEHGHEDYAQFIRLLCRLNREVMPRENRDALRRSRYELWTRMVQGTPLAFDALHLHVNNYQRGFMRWDLQVRADAFVRSAASWWPIIHPRYLDIIEGSGFEPQIARQTYPRGLRALTCSGTFREMRWDPQRGEWAELAPLAGELLAGLVAAEFRRLEALRLEPLLASSDTLSKFARSTLADQLAECELVLLLSDGGERRVIARGTPGSGHVRAAIDEFLVAHAARLIRH